MKLLVVLVNEAFNRWGESSRQRGFLLSRGPAQEAIEDLVENLAEIKQILEETIAWDEMSPNGLLGCDWQGRRGFLGREPRVRRLQPESSS